MNNNTHKTISATSKGFIISFGDTKKHQWISYENKQTIVRNDAKEQDYTKSVFNSIQQQLYSECVYGLNKKQENISETNKEIILKKWEKSQKVLNAWKAEIVNSKMDGLLSGLFFNSEFIKKLINIKPENDVLYTDLSFKSLKITQKMIAEKLISVNLLPQNFFTL